MPEAADLIIMNSCTVTAEAESKTRKALRGMLARYPAARLLVYGCAVAVDDGYYTGLGDRVLAAASQAQALELLGGWLGGPEAGSIATQPAPPRPSVALARQRPSLKVQDGCDSRCSYCIVCRARGPARSEPLPALQQAARDREAAGAAEIVLTGVNLGSYSWQGLGLIQMIEGLLAATDRCRFRLSSLEPLDATEQLTGLIASHPDRLCRHLHLPLQSGSDRVLAAMGRPYDRAGYIGIVDSARRRLPGLALSTDVIVGFPGETDDDFSQSVELCRQAAFMRIHVFRYSPRRGTPAAELPGQVPAAVKAQRAATLRSLSLEMARADFEARTGSCELALVERPGVGRSESYHLVAVPENAAPGSLVEFRFDGQASQLLE